MQIRANILIFLQQTGMKREKEVVRNLQCTDLVLSSAADEKRVDGLHNKKKNTHTHTASAGREAAEMKAKHNTEQ